MEVNKAILETVTSEQKAALLASLEEDWARCEKDLKDWSKEDVVVEDEETGEIEEPDDDDELVQRAVWAVGGVFKQFLRKHLR
jgi:hypothetical protein